MNQWENLTVSQFQDIHRLSINSGLDETSKAERAIAILYNLSEAQVDELPLIEFNRLARECQFLQTDKIPGKSEKYIKAGTNKYGIVYDVRKLKHRQYVEILHFAEKPIENMHLIMASLVQRVSWNPISFNPFELGFWKTNKAKDHEAIANDMLNARLIDVYHSCVFFCNVYMGLIEVIKASLEAEMMSKGMNKNQAKEMVHTSLQAMRGFIQPQKLPDWSA